jgi:hypothetical protein
MKYKIGASLPVMLLCLITMFSAGSAFAQNTVPEQKQKPGLYLLSQTDMDSVKDEELKSVYREADASLIDQVRDGLAAREINVVVVKSERDIIDPARFILVVKLDIELGGKRPFGRTAKVKGNYSFQNKDRFDLVKRTHEETSVQKWQNCITKISEKIVADTAGDLAKQSVPQTAVDKQVKPKQAPAGSAAETRLRELENLKAKGLVTEKEYEEKRKEILKEL